MHICFNALDYPTTANGGGVGNQVRLLAKSLVGAGHRVSVIDLTNGNQPEILHDDGVTIHRIRCSNWHWYLSRLPLIGRLLVLSMREVERSWAAYKCIRAIHQSDPIDLIEGTETGMLFLSLLMAFLPILIRLHGEPYTFVKHTPGSTLTIDLRLCRRLQRLALRRARLLVSPSFRHAQEIRDELGKSVPPLEIVPNMISSELFAHSRSEDAISERNKDEIHGPVVLFVGRLEHGKGVPLLLRAARRVLADVPNAHFVLAGARHPNLRQEELDQLLRQLPDSKRIHLLGHVPWERLLDWYGRATLCVLPSYYETFGLAALESMAMGLPVAALSAGALSEVVEDQVTGLLVPPHDEVALAEAITRLLKNPELRHRLGENGRRAAERFLVTKHFRDNLTLFSWASRAESVERGDAREHIFFSPHLDDAALSCGGLISALVGCGEKVRAITVFAGRTDPSKASAFARHLHEKWGLRDSPADRREEDHRAFRRLGVAEVEQWELPDTPYRHDESGTFLYCTYDELKGKPADADRSLLKEIVRRIGQSLPASSSACRLYFPLGLGGHVDHQLVFQVGLRLRAEGWDVRFYEDWPYAEAYEVSDAAFGWMSERVDISVAAKQAAILEHRSQMPGLGGSAAVLRARLTRYGQRVGAGRPQERYWLITPTRAERMIENKWKGQCGPLESKPQRRLSWSKQRILSLLHGVQLTQLLPRGSGECILLHGDDDERAVVEVKGYRCRSLKTPQECGSIAPTNSAAFVVWRPMATMAAEQLIPDAASLLEPGGVLVGRLSGDNREHLKELLLRQGFRDIQMSSEFSGAWCGITTLFRCCTVAFVARKAAVRTQCTSGF